MKKTALWQDKILYIVNYAILILIIIIVGYPLILVVSNSLSSPDAVTAGKVWLFPVDFSLKGYQAVFKDITILKGYRNSLFYMVVGTAINMIVTIICAYSLSVKTLPGRKFFMMLFTITMFFGGGLIPTYILVYNLKMTNTIWAMLIPGAMSVWNMIIMRTYFQTNIPNEIREAAKIDGCSDIQYLVRILLPLSFPILAVIALYYAVGHWNSYFNALIYLRDSAIFPLQLILRRILVMNDVSMDMLASDPEMLKLQLQMIDIIKYSVIVIASLPLCIIYPFVQKYFVKGIMVGSVKG